MDLLIRMYWDFYSVGGRESQGGSAVALYEIVEKICVIIFAMIYFHIYLIGIVQMRTNDYIEVSRAVVTSDMDLKDILKMICEIVYENYQKFDAMDPIDVYAEEVYMGYVIVVNHAKAKYFMAEYGVDQSGNVVMDNVREVTKVWMPVDTGDNAGVQRDSKEITMPVYYKHSKSFWGNVL